MRAAAVVFAMVGATVAVAVGIGLVLVGAASDLAGDGETLLTTTEAVLWFGLAALAGGAGALIRREPRRAAMVLAIVAVGGVVVCGAWWLAVAPFPAVAACLAWAGRGGARVTKTSGELA